MEVAEAKRRFGRRVQELRKHKGLTQELLADLIGRSPDTISNIERGSASTRLETAVALARVLDVEVADLFAQSPRRPTWSDGDDRLSEIRTILDGADEDMLLAAKEILETLSRLRQKQVKAG